MTNNSGLRPRWASAPGETIESIIRERNIDHDDVADQLHMSVDDLHDLLNGRYAITMALAKSLSQTLGGSSEFWMTREAQYIDDSHRVAADEWSCGFPTKQMAEFGWIAAPIDWHDRIELCLDFFQVKDVESWQKTYGNQLEVAHYRRSPSYPLEQPATAAWFRACERQAGEIIGLTAFDSEHFQSILSDIRRLTRAKNPKYFAPKLINICASAGVAVVIVRTTTGCPASGVARWYGSNPLIQLSARYLSDDHFWFSFFHEAGHVILHQLSLTFLDVLEGEPSDQYEVEANDFAVSVLTGNADIAAPSRVTSRAVVQIAQQLGVSPGIVVGQLQYSGTLPMNRLNGLKRRYKWNGSNLEMR
jgi:HTH-type transcriptional regulator / antitoxin HigA